MWNSSLYSNRSMTNRPFKSNLKSLIQTWKTLSLFQTRSKGFFPSGSMCPNSAEPDQSNFSRQLLSKSKITRKIMFRLFLCLNLCKKEMVHYALVRTKGSKSKNERKSLPKNIWLKVNSGITWQRINKPYLINWSFKSSQSLTPKDTQKSWKDVTELAICSIISRFGRNNK